ESRWAPSSVPCAVLSPQEMLLDSREVATLWYLLTGGELDPAGARELCEASDGWYRPLRLALDATGGVGLDQPTPEQLLEVSPVRYFLRHEVLHSFSTEERDLLLASSLENDERDDGEAAWHLLESRGLWIEGDQRDRLPRLLAAMLERERQRRGTPKAAPDSSRPTPREPPPRAEASRPVYRLGLLGSPVAQFRDAQGEHPLDWRLKRSFQILAFLGSSPELQATREDLIEAIWPTEGERTIERNFHPTLSHLRRALEGDRKGSGPAPLLFRNGIYRLNPEITWEIDVLDFGRHIETGKELAGRQDSQGAAESLRSAWKLYRGPFLQGHYEAWITARREEYQRQYLEMLRDLGKLYVGLGKIEEAMDAYRSVLLEDPLQEKIHLEVMLLYAGQGRRDLVRRQYDRLCMLLLEELGVEPMPETTREYHKLMG
ncbi:MAG TPA: BTAD domain-containing putative transcriptional regulator, partial [Thermoanaerobaculia bacterium]|nr:BTAD domain-containing putative transcriptional regulator [Thermoanaerobaculia bacterium]